MAGQTSRPPIGRSVSRLSLLAACVLILAGAEVTAFASGSRASDATAAAFPGANGKIYFDSPRGFSGNYEILSIDAGGSDRFNLTDNEAGDFSPAASSDGQRIAFTSNRDGNLEIYGMNASGAGQTRLTNDPAADTDPAFAPDGQRIVFVRSGSSGNGDIWAMDADGSDQVNLTDSPGANDLDPAVSPDGDSIAFASDGDVYTMSAAGQSPTQLTDAAAFDRHPAFSPDGTQIAFTTGRDNVGDGNDEIYVMDADGTDESNVSSNPARDSQPAFSPNGERIAFVRENPSLNEEIFVMDSDNGSSQSNLTRSAGDEFNPDWAIRETVPPRTTITRKPAKRTSARKASFAFRGSDRATPTAQLRFRCSLDGGRYRACRSPRSYRGLEPGRHSFKVRAIDAAGNADPSPASHAWRVRR